MNTTRRSLRFFWLLGILVLLGTAVGAGWMLNHAPAQNVPPKGGDRERERYQPGADVIICLGYVDVERGVTPLHPLQGGRVTHLWVHEGDPVSEGELLLSLDDRLARLQLAEAKADLMATKQQQAKLEQLRKSHKDKIGQQENAVDAARHNARAVGYLLGYKRKLFDLKQISREEVSVEEEKEKALESLVRVEEGKLKELRDYDFGPDRARARDAVDAKQVVVERARLALTECDLYAPADGTVLRLFVTEGEPLGAQPKLPAIQFCPATPRVVRAEVQQEWASKVEVGQVAIVEDDTRAGPQWQGRIKSVSDWFTKRRSQLLEPFQFNDVRTLECLVTVSADARHMRIGQRMRVIIKQGGP